MLLTKEIVVTERLKVSGVESLCSRNCSTWVRIPPTVMVLWSSGKGTFRSGE